MSKLMLALLGLSLAFLATPQEIFAKGDSSSPIRCGRKGLPNCGIRRSVDASKFSGTTNPHHDAVWCSGDLTHRSACFNLQAGTWEYTQLDHYTSLPDRVVTSRLQLVTSNFGQAQSTEELLRVPSPHALFVSARGEHEILCVEGQLVDRRSELDPITGSETQVDYLLAPRRPWHGNQTVDVYFQRDEVNPYWMAACTSN